MTKLKKRVPASPEATERSKLVQAHVQRVLEAANKGEIPLPTATKARVIVHQTLEFLNNRVGGSKTITPIIKKQIAAAIDVIKDSFKREGVPMPQAIIDSWVQPGRVHLRICWAKSDEYQLSIDQLRALAPADEATERAVTETIAGLQKVVR